MKNIELWNKEIKNNQSFYGRVEDICNIANCSKKELQKFWLDNQIGLLSIFAFVRLENRLPVDKSEIYVKLEKDV